MNAKSGLNSSLAPVSYAAVDVSSAQLLIGFRPRPASFGKAGNIDCDGRIEGAGKEIAAIAALAEIREKI